MSKRLLSEIPPEVVATAVMWTCMLMDAGLMRGKVVRPPPELKQWWAADPMHRAALRALVVAALRWKARTGTTAARRELELALGAKPIPLWRRLWAMCVRRPT